VTGDRQVPVEYGPIPYAPDLDAAWRDVNLHTYWHSALVADPAWKAAWNAAYNELTRLASSTDPQPEGAPRL
jgi:hypothetical protein